MSLSPAELAHVAAELGPVLSGAHIQKISFATQRVVVLELRIPGRSILLRLDVTPTTGHVGVVDHRDPSPEKALAVQGLWRAHLMGARVDRISTEARTLSFDCSTDAGPRLITIELRRNGGALLLLDATRHVLGVSPPDAAVVRGAVWSPPPAEGADRNRLESIAADRATLAISQAAARLYETATEAQALNQTKTAVLSALRGARKRLARTVAKVEADRQRILDAARYQQYGDLLKPMLSRLKRGATTATLTAWGEEGAVEVEVPLLPQLGPRENMERYYHLYRRRSRAAGKVDERLAHLRSQLEAVETLLAEAEGEADGPRLAQLLDEARRSKLLAEPMVAQPGPGEQVERIPFREFVSAVGQRIWVGRNAKDNDSLTFRHARGNDLWLHARSQTGSHVVIPGLGAPGTDGETLLDAAELAAHFSAGRDETFVEVSSTRTKYVRKPKGAPPGAVTFSQEKAIQLRREPERLARLLASERKAT